MTNSVAARENAIARMVTLVEAVTSGIPSGTSIVKCWRHEPVAIYESRMAAVVYKGTGEPPEERATLGNRMVALRFDVNVYWQFGGMDPGYLDDVEKELVDVDRALTAAFEGDNTLDGNVSALYVRDTDTGYIQRSSDGGPSQTLRVLTVPVELVELEAEAIAP